MYATACWPVCTVSWHSGCFHFLEQVGGHAVDSGHCIALRRGNRCRRPTVSACASALPSALRGDGVRECMRQVSCPTADFKLVILPLVTEHEMPALLNCLFVSPLISRPAALPPCPPRWVLFRRGSRPIIMQQALDIRKRLKGPPTGGGTASIVVTDIEGRLPPSMMSTCL